MKIKSYPKVNLGLYVTGKKDNLHELDSIFIEITNQFHDILDVEIIEEDKLIFDTDNKEIDINNNTVVAAYKLLKDKYKFKQGIKVFLTKNIPLGSGLGGGSSNAASFIRAVDALLDLDLDDDELKEIGIEIGSDVPFFMHGGVCRVFGVGDKIIPVDCEIPSIKLLLNDYHISTKDVFSNFDFKDQNENNIEEIISMLMTESFDKDLIKNDLEQAIFKTDDKYKKHVLETRSKYKNIYISGSGSTLFSIK